MIHVYSSRDQTTTTDDSLMPVRILSWRPIHKGTVIAAADILLGKSLEIHGIMVLHSNERMWCAFPGKVQVGPDDKIIRNNGKIQYGVVLKWTDRVAGNKFNASVIDAIVRQYGEAALSGAGDAS